MAESANSSINVACLGFDCVANQHLQEIKLNDLTEENKLKLSEDIKQFVKNKVKLGRS
ncbi:hypothetical protein H6G97_46080 [Nostoc flagelliforme FACHB-838]|uniref:Uncharacterized protein n=1 Tax=Nostoc flagelliforme FACHB-838 TaxID=2692904 RepID=A0ABR8E3H0_9NOSO|nr:hypothetical protein [Nostoc flagelliforme]MBD2536272.1 hypothetical protein [Nostoc flagelliforme FACHB-838]